MKNKKFEPDQISEKFLLDNKVSHSPKLFIVIYKENNGESIMMKPVINKLTEEFYKKLNFYTIDYMESKDIRKLYNIEIAPCFIIFIDSKPKEIVYGLTPFNELKLLIDKYLG